MESSAQRPYRWIAFIFHFAFIHLPAISDCTLSSLIFGPIDWARDRSANGKYGARAQFLSFCIWKRMYIFRVRVFAMERDPAQNMLHDSLRCLCVQFQADRPHIPRNNVYISIATWAGYISNRAIGQSGACVLINNFIWRLTNRSHNADTKKCFNFLMITVCVRIIR